MHQHISQLIVRSLTIFVQSLETRISKTKIKFVLRTTVELLLKGPQTDNSILRQHVTIQANMVFFR